MPRTSRVVANSMRGGERLLLADTRRSSMAASDPLRPITSRQADIADFATARKRTANDAANWFKE
jgi:hypothetical protein